MGRALPRPIRILAVIAALALVQGCREKAQLEKEAPALAHADLKIDRIAIIGVVSDVAALGDRAESRESWSLVIGDRLGRDRFGKLPIVSYREVREILGRDDYGIMLDRFKDYGGCDDGTLAQLHAALEGKARFIVFGNIQKDRTWWSESEKEVVDEKTKKTTSKTKTATTTRSTLVRLRFYDLTDSKLAWDHLTIGESSRSKAKDITDVIDHDPNESFLGSLVTSAVNSTLKPDPKHPPAPELERCLANAIDFVGVYLKPSKRK